MSDILLINGQHIRFSISFAAPPLSEIYKSFTVTDKLIDGLTFNDTDSVVKINGNVIPGYYFLYDDNNNIKCYINNIEGTDNNIIEVILDTTISDRTKITDSSFSNTAFMYLNNDEYLENASNECTVQLKMPSLNELIISPESQRISSAFYENKNLFCDFKFFGVPVQNTESYVVQTRIIDGYTFDKDLTSISITDVLENMQTFNLNEYRLDASYEYNDDTKILTITILNSSEINSRLVNINLSMRPISEPLYDEVNNLVIELFYNTCHSKIIDIKTSSIILRKPINILKSCDKYEKKLDKNTFIYYTMSFIMPKNDIDMDYICFTVSDTLDKCLAFDKEHSAVLCNNVDIKSHVIFPEDKSTGTIDIMFRNYNELLGKKISIKLSCYIYDVSLTPQYNIIYNDAVLIPNSNPLLSSTSNKIGIRLRKYDEIYHRNNVISSIASIEKSNSYILDEEADLLRKSKELSNNEEEIITIRNSINRITNTSSILEHIMYQCLYDTEY